MVFLKSLNLAKPYFIESDEKWYARLMLALIIVTTISLVLLISCFSWWTAAFWAALAAKDIGLFFTQLLNYSFIIMGIVASIFIREWASNHLEASWTKWMRQDFIQKYLMNDENNFVEILRCSEDLPNPEDRIQNDVKFYVKQSLSLSKGILFAVLQLSFAIGSLWYLGGSLGFSIFGINFIIPGFLVWATLIFSSLAAYITHIIGKSLNLNNQNLTHQEAELRNELQFIKQKSEYIAQENGQNYFLDVLNEHNQDIRATEYENSWLQANIHSFRTFYKNLAPVFPYIMAAPLYFSGQVDLGAFMQLGFIFGQVNDSLDWFVDSYERLASYQSHVERICQLQQALNNQNLNLAARNIQFERSTSYDSIHVKLNHVYYPQDMGRSLFENIDLNFTAGENILFSGDNGCGKSSLFKIIAGTWRYGDGVVRIPHNTMFFSQLPTIPINSLPAILAYPNHSSSFNDEEYAKVLNRVGLSSYISRLSEDKKDWYKTLSQGEQQKLAFARVLLNKPKFLFLDEATASLSEDNEHAMYTCMADELSSTSLLSIGHRPGIHKYHSRILFFKRADEQITEIGYLPQASNG